MDVKELTKIIRIGEGYTLEFKSSPSHIAREICAFAKAAGLTSGLKKEDVLKNLNVISKEGMVNAGVLLFGKRVPYFFLQACVSCALFQGTGKAKILDHAVFDGGIYENYDAATAYLQSHLNTEYVIKSGPREEILELPEEALREALLNAMAHRDYRATSHIQVNIYRDRVEIWNPGGLVPGLKLKDLGHVSRPRNLLLFSLMARMDLVENIGSGIKRIRNAISAYKLKPPIIKAEENWFSITFMRKGAHDALDMGSGKKDHFEPVQKNLTGRVNGGINEGMDALLKFIQKTPGLRAPQISKAMNMPVTTLEHWLKRLKSQNRIEFRGSSKTGGYHGRYESFSRVNGRVNGRASGGINGGINEAAEDYVKALTEFIEKNPGLRMPQIAEAMNVPRKTIEKRLKKLKSACLIEFRGTKRTGGYWVKR